jgi:hypothetical protein
LIGGDGVDLQRLVARKLAEQLGLQQLPVS